MRCKDCESYKGPSSFWQLITDIATIVTGSRSALVIVSEGPAMSQRLNVELSDAVYDLIQRQAAESSMSPAQVVSASLEHYFQEQYGRRGTASKAQLRAASERFEQHFGAVDLGYATGADNEEIDADLERDYADAHEKA